MKKIICRFVCFGLMIILLVFSLGLISIYSGVKTACQKAKNQYQKDCRQSLMMAIENDEYSFREKNSAIWALGQLADKKSLPFLQGLLKELPEGKCRHDKFVCRYEVEKAIKWCTGGNLTSWMYKSLY